MYVPSWLLIKKPFQPNKTKYIIVEESVLVVVAVSNKELNAYC